MTEQLNQIIEMINQITKDNTVPRNIKKGAEEAKNILEDDTQEIKERASSAVYLLESITNDRNLPMHARTTLWSIAGALESLQNP